MPSRGWSLPCRTLRNQAEKQCGAFTRSISPAAPRARNAAFRRSAFRKFPGFQALCPPGLGRGRARRKTPTPTGLCSKAQGWRRATPGSARGQASHPQRGCGAAAGKTSHLPNPRGHNPVGVENSCIARQEEHHRKRDFQEELRALLRRHQIPYDEKHLWD